MKRLTWFVIFAICFAAAPRVHSGDLPALPTREQLQSLPLKYASVVPSLEIEASARGADQIDFLITLLTQSDPLNHGFLYNPFGDGVIGSPFQIIVTDSNWNPVWQVLESLPANQSVPEPSAWIRLQQGRIIGRRFLRHTDWTRASTELEIQHQTPPKLAAGDYLLHLVATRRLVTEPPFEEGPNKRAESQNRWRGTELDQYACRSQPVLLQISPDGKIIPPSTAAPPEVEYAPRVTTSVKDQRLSVQTMLIVPRDRWCRDPGLVQGDVFRSTSGVWIDITNTDGNPPDFVDFKFLISMGDMDNQQPRMIPVGGILGLLYHYPPTRPGKYRVAARFSNGIWQDRRDSDPEPPTTMIEVTVEP